MRHLDAALVLFVLWTGGRPLAAEGTAPLEAIRQLIRGGRYAEAETAARALRPEVEASAGADSLDAARVLDVLVEALYRGGKAAEDEPRRLADRAVALKESALGPDHLEVGQSLNQLGNLLLTAGDYAAAKPFYERALAVREKALGPVHIDIAVSLHNLALVHWRLGELSTVQSLYERALAIDEEVRGPDSPEVAHVLDNLGNLLRDVGDYAGARSRLERSVSIRERTLGPDHPDVANSLNDLAIVLKDLGDYASAQPLFERAVAIDEKALGPDHPILGLHLSSLGSALLDHGEYANARPRLERARAILDREGVADRLWWAAEPTAGLGDLLRATGDPLGARRYFERALEIVEKNVGPDHFQVATMACLLSEVLLETGDARRAQEHAARAIAIAEKNLGTLSPQLARCLAAFAQATAATGDSEHALAAALRAEAVSRQHLQLTARVLAERQALTYASTRTSGLDLALSLLANDPAMAPRAAEVLDAVIGSRALVLDEMAARHGAVRDASDPEAMRRADALAAARGRLTRLVVRGPQGGSADTYLRLVEEARRQKERIEQDLAERSASFREELSRSRFGLREVRGALPARTALVSFIRYAHIRTPAGSGRPPAPVLSYLALILAAGQSKPVFVPLGKAEEVDALVARWRDQIALAAAGAGRASRHLEPSYRTASADLRKRVWDPVARHLEGEERVFLVPDGALHLVSLGTLAVDGTGYLVESGPLIQYLSAERDLMAPEAILPRRGLLALAAPSFDGDAALVGRTGPERTIFRGTRSGCADFQSLRFDPLPASGTEMREVAGVWRRGPASGGDPAVQLRGADATEAAFKQQAPGRRVLHLATHGFFLGDRCASALDSAGTGVRRPSPAAENPLLLAGLALAGANRRARAAPDEEDGILTAEEVAALDLRGVEWAVLSACDTGAGEVRKGEGVFGLRRAFQLAGVRTVVMSLWPVEDDATRAWMRALYGGRFLRGLSSAEAVREATVTLLRKRRAARRDTHPFHWGGFIAVGDWR